MSLLLLLIVFPAIVLSVNNTNNLNITSRLENLSAIFYNTSKSDTFLNITSHIDSGITKYTKAGLLQVNNAQKNTKSKSQNKKKPKKIKKKEVKPLKRDLPDMPLESDLEELMDSINKVLDFFLENKNDVDISVNYGLFLLNVNLKSLLNSKRHSLPSGISFGLKHILEKNDELLTFFKQMVDQDNNADDDLSKSLTTLFNHDRLWLSVMQKFDGARVIGIISDKYDTLAARYSYWEKYLDNVGDFEKAQPRPDQSNRCLSFLAKNHANRDFTKKNCKIPVQCKNPIAKGTDYGYGLTHRLLYLQLAYYGHHCYVFSNKKDKEMRERFCKKMYAEATYISLNEYGAIDLFVEQLCLCALDGHYEFLRRSWLQTVMDFQTDLGCFSDVTSDKRPGKPTYDSALRHRWQLDKGENQYILGGHCNVHTTSAAVATLGFGVKFILEAYY